MTTHTIFTGGSARFSPPGEDPSDPARRMPDPADQDCFCTVVTEYRGIWHAQPPFFPEYGPKYGGGLGTYPYQTRPLAVYAPQVHRTFFCWGGSRADSDPNTRHWDFGPGALLQMVSAFDHTQRRLLPPVCVFDKWCADPHDNPALQIAPDGHLWLFSPSHGHWTTRSFIHRSLRPFDHTAWETISDEPLFAYPQPWIDSEFGWMFLHTEYHHGRGLRIRKSDDGRRWTPSRPIADFGVGHYQVSWFSPRHRRLCSAFDYHPPQGGLDARTNLYFIQSRDGGETFETVDGRPLSLPLTAKHTPALVHDFEAEGRLVYLRDVKLTREGDPLILFVTSRGFEPGPANGPHEWRLARWSAGAGWHISTLFTSDNNYDHGELWIGEHDWRIVAPTDPGPQPFNPGGEVVLWVSEDEGHTWQRRRQITASSRYNHTFCRVPVNAHPDFHAFWADGHACEPSGSALYFCDRDGNLTRMEAFPGE